MTSARVPVPTADDSVYEGDETFALRLSNANGATVANAAGTGTITDNDPLPFLSVGTPPAAAEGGTVSFAVELSAPSGLPVTVDYVTGDGSATAPDDYTAVSGGRSRSRLTRRAQRSR